MIKTVVTLNQWEYEIRPQGPEAETDDYETLGRDLIGEGVSIYEERELKAVVTISVEATRVAKDQGRAIYYKENGDQINYLRVNMRMSKSELADAWNCSLAAGMSATFEFEVDIDHRLKMLNEWRPIHTPSIRFFRS